MSNVDTILNILILSAVIGFIFIVLKTNAELNARVSCLENMVKEREQDGVIYSRYLEKVSNQ